jgi:hypothetical protein
MTFKVSGPSAEHLRGLTSGLGAVLTGRRPRGAEVGQHEASNHGHGLRNLKLRVELVLASYIDRKAPHGV